MHFNVKTISIIAALFIILGIAVYFANETSAEGKTYKIGDKGPADGWIFYDKGEYSDGWRYLEAAPEDQSEEAKWGCYEKSIGAKSTAIGKGKANTAAIIKNCGEAEIAAKLCTAYRGGGKSDWFLPSKEELYMMYKNLHKNGFGGFAVNYYWNSSEYNDNNAWGLNFRGGYQYSSAKYYPVRIRAVRAF